MRWKDEFDSGPKLDDTKWTYHFGDGSDIGEVGWYNKEKQCYTNEEGNIHIDPTTKSLVITAKIGGPCKNAKTGESVKAAFTSAKIVHKEPILWKGKAGASTPVLISARMKVPLGDKSFPALWLLPHDKTNPWCSGCGKYGGWPSSGEIDIMEHLNKEMKIYATIHVGPSPDKRAGFQKAVELPQGQGPDEWHTYSLLWDSTYLKTFVDDKPLLDVKVDEWAAISGNAQNKYAPFDAEMHLIINHAVGGRWPGLEEPDPKDFPYSVYVDYVAVHDVTL